MVHRPDRVHARREETLANNANTTDANGTFAVSGRQGFLTSVHISVTANDGPCLAGAFLFQETGNLNGTSLGPRQWIRSPGTGGQTGDIYDWHGRAPFSSDAEIRIFVRNDTGSSVLWAATWVTE